VGRRGSRDENLGDGRGKESLDRGKSRDRGRRHKEEVGEKQGGREP
jgi:hypothetical protein